MQLFRPKHGDPVGFIFDINLCHLKDEKYIFSENGDIDAKWWLKQKGLAENKHKVKHSITLAELRTKLKTDRENDIIPMWNDLAIGLSQAGLVGVFATENNINARIRAIQVKQAIQKKIGKDLPIFIITPQEDIKLYHGNWQWHDIATASHYDNFQFPHNYIKKIKKRNNAISNMIKKQEPVNMLMRKYHNKILREFFISPFIPEEVKKLTLSFMTFPDLVKFNNALDKVENMEPLKKLVSNWIDHIKKPQLVNLLRLAKENKLIDSIKVTFPTDKKSMIYQEIINDKNIKYQDIINSNIYIFGKLLQNIFDKNNIQFITEKSEFINHLLVHFCYQDLNLLRDFLSTALKNSHYQLATDLLELGIDPFYSFKNWNLFNDVIIFMNFNHFHYFDYAPAQNMNMYFQKNIVNYVESEIEVLARINFCPLLIAAIYRELELVSLLAEKFSSQIALSLKELKKIEKVNENHNSLNFSDRDGGYSFTLRAEYFANGSKDKRDKSIDVNSHPLKKAHIKLLLQLISFNHKQYVISKDEKRMLEAYFLNEIANMQTEKEISGFWDKHKDALYLNQRRHSLYDRFFRDKNHVPTIKQTVKDAADKKRIEIINQLEKESTVQLTNLNQSYL